MLSPRAVVALATLVLASTACRAPKTTEQSLFGDISPTEDVDFAPYIATARAIVTHRPLPPPPAAPRRGERAFVTVWSPSHKPLVGTGIGDTLIESVSAAAKAITEEIPRDVRLQVDVVSGAERIVIANEMTESLPQLGLHGYLAVADSDQIGFVLPTEILAFQYFDPRSMGTDLPLLDRERILQTLGARAGLGPGVREKTTLEKMTTYRITTTSHIESPGLASGTLIFRSMPLRPTALTAGELIDAVRAGADYLAGALDAEGRFRYCYRPVEDKESSDYGLLRHAGAIYALLEAYGELGDPRYLAKAELALSFLESFYGQTPDGSFLTDTMKEEQQKVGGAGLALLALAKHAELAGRTTNLERMRSLARFIEHQQYPDGHFRNNADVRREDATAKDKPLRQELFYYPGEAILGLMRLYRIDRQPKLIETAERAAQFLMVRRDAQADDNHQIHDHWLSYALLDLYREKQVEAYADHAFKIARSIVKSEAGGDGDRPADFVGTFYSQGSTTPTSTRLEALAAALELSLSMKRDHAWLDEPAMQLACFMRGQQYDASSNYFVKVPAKALGGVRESLFINDIRIDYVQHALCAWLHLARALRHPSYGRPPPGATEPPEGD